MKKNALLGKNKRYERESIVFTAALVVLVIVVNLILFSLAQNYGWYISAIDKQYYTLSGATDDYFDSINPEKEEIEFYFCMSETELNADYTYGRIYDTVRQFEERYEGFSVHHLDIYYDYERLSAFASAHDTTLGMSSVIVSCPDRGTSAIGALADFYIYDEESAETDEATETIFNGEEVVAALVARALKPSEERRTAYFTVGHGEAASLSLRSLLVSAGYDVLTADLSLFDIEDDCDLIFISSPTYDFEEYTDAATPSELSRLRNFIDGGGTVIYLRSPDVAPLPRLDAFFASYGLLTEGGTYLRDAEQSVALNAALILSSLSPDAGVIGQTVEKYSTAPVLAGHTSAIRFTAPADYLSDRVSTRALLSTSEAAVEYRLTEQISTAPAGGYTVAAMSEVQAGDTVGHAILFSGLTFVYTAAVETDAYANEELLYSLIAHTQDIPVPLGCGQVLLNSYPLENLTRPTANLILLLLALPLPAAIAVTGVAVCIRRRRR